jgi:hypothetical protein
MKTAVAASVFAAVVVLFSPSLHSQDGGRYREFQLGSGLAAVSAQTSVPATEAKTIHQRPALMQELEWRRPYFVSGSTRTEDDPVKQIVFSFYDDQLSKIVVDYDRDRTAGMTDADMIDAISAAYGPVAKPSAKAALMKPRAAGSDLEEKSGKPVARWADVDRSVVLYRSSYAQGFQLVVTSPKLEALAQTAEAHAIRMDEREAPQRELARQKKEVEAARAAKEKARLTNKAVFRP